MTQIQVGSPERRVARWVIYAVLAAPIIATWPANLGHWIGVVFNKNIVGGRKARDSSMGLRERLTSERLFPL